MIKRPTVLILGAGASMEFNFPSGRKLTDLVLGNTGNPISNGYKRLVDLGVETEDLGRFTHALKFSGRKSVDEFLEVRPEFIEIGKLAMASVLIDLENKDVLFLDRDNWYFYLYERMGSVFEDFGKNPLCIVTFNYDRSLETFLFTALKNSYNKPDEEVAEALSRIPILHVHGVLGDLPWQSENGRPYGPVNRVYEVKEAADNIKIISDDSHIEESFEPAWAYLRSYDRVIFLGFGYNKTNLERLVQFEDRSDLRIYGTGFGLTKLEREEIEQYFDPIKAKLGIGVWEIVDLFRNVVPL